MTSCLTLLSSILGGDFAVALERQRAIGIEYLDLKDGLWDKTIEHLDADEAQRAHALITEHGMQVHCFSTSIGHTSLEPATDEAAFRALHDAAIDNAIRVADVLHPQVIRLLAPKLVSLPGDTAAGRLRREFPWVIGLYRGWVDRITDAGFGVLIENEAWDCLLGSVRDIQIFFADLQRPDVRYTWDIQNLWQMGTFPTLDVYRELRPLIGAVHLKGGRAGDDGKTLAFAAPLDEASWPVLDIVRAVVADGAAPYICLNPSHGQKPPGWNNWEIAQREVAFLRREIRGIA
ncbi:MAG: TIM barrel protein [Armatimonadota bacterium]